MTAMTSLIDKKVTASLKEINIQALHVDDDLSIQNITKMLLQDIDSSLEIYNASSVDEALEKISAKNYDVIISDYEMPNKNGLDLLKKLKENNNQTPFILFTGKGREEIAVKALNMGADGYYNKQGEPETVYTELAHAIQYATTKKRAEAKLQETQHLNQKILNSTPNLIYIFNLEENRNTYSNKEIIEFLGYTTHQIQAMGSKLFENLLHPEDEKAVLDHHKRFLSAPDEAVYELDYRMKHSDGEWRWLHSYDTVFARSKDGKCKQILGICEDITERVKKETQFSLLAENSQDVIWTMDLAGQFTYISPSIYQLRGFTAEEAKKQTFKDIFTPDSLEVAQRYLDEFQRTGNVPSNFIELEHTCKDGSTVWVEVNFSIIKDKNGNFESILGVTRNINKRREMEATLKDSEEKYRNLVENTQDAISIVDFTGKVLFANKASETLTGYPLNEITNIKDVTPKKLWLKSLSILLKARLGKPVPYFKYEIRRKNGSIVPVETGGQAIFKDGKPVAIQIITRDISERKKADEQILNDRSKLKALNEKLRVVGGLTRHDVKNKHSAIKSHTYLMRKKIGDNPELLKHLEAIDSIVNQSEKIFEFSRLYEKIGAEDFVKVNVGENFEEAIKLLPELNSVKFLNECHSLTIFADSMLRQLFYNLLDNSYKHGGKVTEIRISYYEDHSGIRLFYEDNGVGIAMGLKDKIFEGFSTGGSGLGLKLVKRMVESYGWSIKENGIQGKGARFEITIPLIT